jgi:hypothetical protein
MNFLMRLSLGLEIQTTVSTPEVICQCYEAITAWHLGEITSCQATMVEAISLAKELNDMHALAVALFLAAILGHFERPPIQVERCASDLIELSTRQNFALWLAAGKVLRGWARSASGGTAEGLSRIEDGIEEWRASGSMWTVPYFLALKAEALHLADRTSGSAVCPHCIDPGCNMGSLCHKGLFAAKDDSSFAPLAAGKAARTVVSVRQAAAKRPSHGPPISRLNDCAQTGWVCPANAAYCARAARSRG